MEGREIHNYLNPEVLGFILLTSTLLSESPRMGENANHDLLLTTILLLVSMEAVALFKKEESQQLACSLTTSTSNTGFERRRHGHRGQGFAAVFLTVTSAGSLE